MGPPAAGLQEIEDLFSNVISVLVGIGFIAMLVMLTWAGFKYLTSGGEQKAIQQAHQIVTWAILGIFFMAIAWLILLLISTFTGIELIKTFDIKTLCNIGKQNFCK